MQLTTSDLAYYLGCSQPLASKFKKEIKQHTQKNCSRVTIADLCDYEKIGLEDALFLLGKKQTKK